MKRTLPIIAVLLLAACGPAEPTNVVLIIVDDLGWMDTGVYGSPFYQTPNIDRLAANGLRFTQFYSASPVCSPTRASIMSGKHPARLDLTNWIGGEQNGLLNQAEYIRQLPSEEETMGETFREHGYATGYIGKWHLGRGQYLPPAQGFDYTFAVNDAGQPGSYFPPYENPNWSITNVPDLEGDAADAYLTDRLTDASLEFLQSNRDRPFFLVLSHYAVHTPLQARPEDVARYEIKALALGESTDHHFKREGGSVTKLRQDHPTYAAMIESTDQSVGRVLDKLEELHLDQRTVVVFVSDNGGLSTLRRQGFNLATSNLPLRSGKGWLYEGGIRIPLIIQAPGMDGGSVSTASGMTTDLYPTILQVAGLPLRPDQHLDGRNLLDQTVESAPLFWHFPHYHGSGNKPGGAARLGDQKLVEWFEDGSIELYDLAEDPGEAQDVATDRPEDARRLHQALHDWRMAVGANMPTPAG